MTESVGGGQDDERGGGASGDTESFSRILLEIIPGIFYLYDTDGRFLRWNRDFERVSGYSSEEIAKLHPLDLFAEDQKQLLRERIGAVFERGVASVEAEFLTKDGRKIPHFFTGRRIEFEGRTCLVGVGLDITERVAAERALVQSEERYRTTLDGIIEGCQLLDFDLRYLYLNATAAVQNRRPNSELLGRRMPDAWPGIEHTEVFQMIRRCRDERVALHREIEFVFGDGVTGWFDIRCQPVPQGIFILSIDISDRVMAQRALRESEQRFRQLAESVDDVFWLVEADLSGTSYVSPAHERVWGTPAEELSNAPLSWLGAVHPEDRKHIQETLPSYAQGDWDQTFRLLGPKGNRWIRARSHPVRDADGNVQRLAIVSRDVTDYRALEERFRQAQKMEAVGRLAAGVAHDFNNVLSVILSYAQLVLDEAPLDETARGDLLEIVRSGERAAELTHQLLAFSRRQVLSPQLVKIPEVLRSMAKMLERLLGEDVTLDLLADSQVGAVHADPGQLEQVIMNLAVNARDAMPRGGRFSVEVSAAYLDEDYAANHPGAKAGDYVLVAVSDNGSGMDASTKERIFEPFFTTKEEGKGTGLGLSTVFGIVQQSGGHIYVYSELDLGTTFQIYLPVATRATPSLAPRPPTTLPPVGTETILVVEDNESVREALGRILRRAGYRVLLADGGQSGLALSTEYREVIHLLVTDVVMPLGDGRQLARQIVAQRPDIAVLFLSGYTEHAAVQNGVIDPGAVFLQKPVTPERILSKVREVLS